MSVVSDIFAGGVSGVLEGVGSLALKMREAITGKTVLSSEDQIKLMEIANEMDRLHLQAETALRTAQLEINKVEASSTSVFTSGWRPAVGWVCVLGLFYTLMVRPFMPWLLTAAGKPVPALPDIDMGTVLTLLGGMLGLGTLRTVERINGKA